MKRKSLILAHLLPGATLESSNKTRAEGSEVTVIHSPEDTTSCCLCFTMRANTTKQPLGLRVTASAKDGLAIHISDLWAENTVLKRKKNDTKQEFGKKCHSSFIVMFKNKHVLLSTDLLAYIHTEMGINT